MINTKLPKKRANKRPKDTRILSTREKEQINAISFCDLYWFVWTLTHSFRRISPLNHRIKTSYDQLGQWDYCKYHRHRVPLVAVCKIRVSKKAKFIRPKNTVPIKLTLCQSSINIFKIHMKSKWRNWNIHNSIDPL